MTKTYSFKCKCGKYAGEGGITDDVSSIIEVCPACGRVITIEGDVEYA